MKDYKFWVGCICAFVIWKLLFSTDVAKDMMRNIVSSSQKSTEKFSIPTATSKKPAKTPSAEEGIWNCEYVGKKELFRLFLFPEKNVYMSVKSDEWQLVDDLYWQSVHKVFNNPYISQITVDMFSETNAIIKWPAGEISNCVR